MGYIYAVTIQIQPSKHEEWLHYMKDSHIQDVLGTGFFSEASMTKVLKEDEQEEREYHVRQHVLGDHLQHGGLEPLVPRAPFDDLFTGRVQERIHRRRLRRSGP